MTYTGKRSETLKEKCLPLLRQSLCSATSPSDFKANVDSILDEMLTYYGILNLAADHNNIPDLLFPCGNSLETPFLFLGDIHPNLFTNLLRSFIDQDSDHVTLGMLLGTDHQWVITNLWKDPSDELMTRIKRVECRIRLQVQDLLERTREAQRGFLDRVLEDWISSHHSQEGRKKKPTTMVNDALNYGRTKKENEKLVRIFVDANRLRKSVISSIVGALTKHRAALFLEGLCQILVGFKDQVFKDNEADCSQPYSGIQSDGSKLGSLLNSSTSSEKDHKRDNNVLINSFNSGVTAVPSYILVMGKMSPKQIYITMCVFAAAVYGAGISSFGSGMVKRKGFTRSWQDGLWSLLCFFLGGLIPLCCGILIPTMAMKIPIIIAVTALLIGVVVVWDYIDKGDSNEWSTAWILWVVLVVAVAISVGFADDINRLRAID